jgi:hypothetical protein
MTTESRRYNCFTRNGGNAIPKHAGSEAKGSNPPTGLTLLWARNPFRGNFNHWQVSQKEAGLNYMWIFFPILRSASHKKDTPRMILFVETQQFTTKKVSKINII